MTLCTVQCQLLHFLQSLLMLARHVCLPAAPVCRDELQLVTVVLSEESIQYGSELLAPYLPTVQQQQQQGLTISPVVRDSDAVKLLLPWLKGGMVVVLEHCLAVAHLQDKQQVTPTALVAAVPQSSTAMLMNS